MLGNFASAIGFVTNGTNSRGGLSMWRVFINEFKENLDPYLRDDRGIK